MRFVLLTISLIAGLIQSCAALAGEIGVEVVPNLKPEVMDGAGNAHFSFSPDGSLFAKSSISGVEIRDVRSGRLLKVLDWYGSASSFGIDSKSWLFARDGAVRRLDLQSGEENVAFTTGDDSVTMIAVDTRQQTVLTAALDGFKLWDVRSGKLAQSVKVECCIEDPKYLPNEGLVAFHQMDATRGYRILDLRTGMTLQSYKGMPACIFRIGAELAAVFVHQHKIEAVSLAGNRVLRTINIKGDEDPSRSTVRCSPGEDALLVVSYRDHIRIWDIRSGKQIAAMKGLLRAISGARALVRVDIAGSKERYADLLDLRTGELKKRVKLAERHIMGINWPGTVVATTEDLNIVAVATEGLFGIPIGNTEFIDMETGHSWGLNAFSSGPSINPVVGVFEQNEKLFAAGMLWDARFETQPRMVYSKGELVGSVVRHGGAGVILVSEAETLRLIDTSSGASIGELESPTPSVVAISSSTLDVVFVDPRDEQVIKKWSVVTRASSVLLRTSSRGITKLAFSPDGGLLAVADRSGGITVYDSRNNVVATFDGITLVDDVAFSPDGRTLIIASRNGITTGEIASPRKRRTVVEWNALHPSVTAMAPSPTGQYIALASEDKILILDVEERRIVREIVRRRTNSKSIYWTRDGHIVSTENGAAAKVWNSSTGDVLGTLYSSDDGAWAVITPEGFFDGSSEGIKNISVVRGLQLSSVDQVYNALYRPDLVREKLAGDPSGNVRAAAAQLDLDKVMASGVPPRVAITLPASGTSFSVNQVEVHATISDQGGGVGKVEWRVNDVTLGIEERGIRRTDQSAANSIKMSRTLGLMPGENKITVLAYNAAGLIASVPAEITISSVQKAAAKPRLYVLAVGVNDYWDSALRLNFAAPDAKTIGDGFKRGGDKLYEQVEVRTVLDGEVTAEKLDIVFTELGKNVRPQDVFVFFLAGHGKTVDARFYFLPQDFRYSGEDSILKKGVGQNQLQDWVSRIKAQKSVLLFDACESGSLIGDKIAMRGIEEKTAIERMTRAMGRTVLTATTGSKPAIEGYRGHGAFTYTLLLGLEAADSNGDGVVEVTELAQYVDRRLPELTYDAFGMRQVPQMSIVGSNFPLASKVSLLIADGGDGRGATPLVFPIKPTHVVIKPADVYEESAGGGGKLEQLSPGTLVSLVRSDQGWALVVRDNKQIGYVAEDRLTRIQ